MVFTDLRGIFVSVYKYVWMQVIINYINFVIGFAVSRFLFRFFHGFSSSNGKCYGFVYYSNICTILCNFPCQRKKIHWTKREKTTPIFSYMTHVDVFISDMNASIERGRRKNEYVWKDESADVKEHRWERSSSCFISMRNDYYIVFFS